MEYNKSSIEKRNNRIKYIKLVSRKIAYIVFIILLYNIFLIAKSGLSDEGAKDVFGYKAFIIMTQSMKPNINAGDVIIIEPKKEEEIKIGDVITFQRKGEFITHRIINIEEIDEKKIYITKGDNNNVEDSETITFNEIEGTKVVTIPFLGEVILLFQNKIYIILLVFTILVIYLHNRKVIEKRKMRREKKKIEDKRYKEQNETKKQQ